MPFSKPSWFALLLVLCCFAGVGASRADDKSVRAEAFMQGVADEAVAALTQPALSRDERETRSRQLLNDYFAVPAIGQWVLGRYWRTATPSERETYLKLFEDLIVVTYVDRFKRYSGETLEVTRSLVDEGSGDVLVSSQIVRPGSNRPLDVSWRLRPKGDEFKIIDVFVEGVSLGQTQRAEFTATLSRNQGKMEALFDEMRKRIAHES